MNFKMVSLFSLVMAVVTCLVIVMPAGGCTAEQLQQTSDVVHTIETIAPVVAPLVPVIGWPVWSVLGIDIAASLLAAVVAFKKQNETVTK